jgi:PAS domain S-box-containing protein
MTVLLSEEHFRLVADQVDDRAMFLLDAEGHVRTWNLGAQRLKGYAASQIVGEHFGRLYTALDVQLRRPELALRAAAEDGRFEEEGWRRCRDGSLFRAHVALTALRDTQHRLVGFAKVTRDLGAAHISPEDAWRVPLREGTDPCPVARVPRILADVLESASDPCVLTNAGGIALVANTAAARLFCVEREFFARRPLINVVARQDTRSFRALLKELKGVPVGGTHFDTVRMRPRGSSVFVATVRVARTNGDFDVALKWTVFPGRTEATAIAASPVPKPAE